MCTLLSTSQGNKPDVAYQLQLRKSELCQLSERWQSKVRGIPCVDQLWGPGDVDVQSQQTLVEWNNDGSDEDEDDAECSEQEDELFQEAESVAFTDSHRIHSSYLSGLDALY
jgi:hypothetical protein